METEDREEYQDNIYIVILNWNYKERAAVLRLFTKVYHMMLAHA